MHGETVKFSQWSRNFSLVSLKS